MRQNGYPTAETAESLGQAFGRFLGLSLDGDSNQLIVLDERGHRLPDQAIHAIFARSTAGTHVEFSAFKESRYLFSDGGFAYDDAVYAALRFYAIVAEHPGPVSTLASRLGSH